MTGISAGRSTLLLYVFKLYLNWMESKTANFDKERSQFHTRRLGVVFCCLAVGVVDTIICKQVHESIQATVQTQAHKGVCSQVKQYPRRSRASNTCSIPPHEVKSSSLHTHEHMPLTGRERSLCCQ